MLGVLLRFGAEVCHVDVTVFVAVDDDDAQPCHDGARRVGAVGRGGDQAYVAVPIAAGFVVLADTEQAGVLALGAGIGL